MNHLVSRAVLEDSGALKEGISQPISPIIDYSISIYLQSPRELLPCGAAVQHAGCTDPLDIRTVVTDMYGSASFPPLCARK